MPNGLEQRLAEMATRMPEPRADATARARRAVVDAPASVASRTPLRRRARGLGRPLRIAAAIAGGAAMVAVLALLVIATPDGPPAPPAASLRPPLPAGPVTECQEPLLLIRCIAGTDAVRAATPALTGAPWLYRRPGGRLARLSDSPPRPSLVFPPGVTYGEALDSLFTWVALTGRLPTGTTLGPPLPDGVVLLRPADPSQGIAIDLRAPFGYEPATGHVFAPTFVGDTASADAPTVWPRGVSIAVPMLPACMVLADGPAAPAACARGDQPALRGPDPGIAPLPVMPLAAVDAGLTPAADRRAASALRLPVLRRGVGDTATAATAGLADLRGRVVVLTFFASWCEPCAAQAPLLEAAARRYRGGEDAVVLGVAVSDPSADTLSFLDRHRFTFTTTGDQEGETVSAFAVPALPETLFIDRRGRIARRIAGALVSPRQLSVPVEALAAESP